MRIYLAGPRPLPPAASRIEDKRLYLPNGVPFLKGDYVDKGYTHFDVWCIGGAGGLGADGTDGYGWPYYYVGTQIHYYGPRLDIVSDPHSRGGAGGGGGLHRVGGLLSDLPDSCPVVVGAAGADSPRGYSGASGPYTPPPMSNTPGAIYDEPFTVFYPPQAGGDGGVSSFNDTTCRASGGKGGGAAILWDHVLHGHGGDGGIGGRSEAGGGAPGSSSEANGSDGLWDDLIGAGGGGGRSGRYISNYDSRFSNPYQDEVVYPAGSGAEDHILSEILLYTDQGKPDQMLAYFERNF